MLVHDGDAQPDVVPDSNVEPVDFMSLIDEPEA